MKILKYIKWISINAIAFLIVPCSADNNMVLPIIIHQGTTYGMVTSPHTGRVWLDRNLGARQACTASNDTACYGGYYQWGRDSDGHQDLNSTLVASHSNIDINNAGSHFVSTTVADMHDWARVADENGSIRSEKWSKTDGSSICPIGYRVPTVKELKAETVDVSVKNSVDAFKNFLRLPSAGLRNHEDGQRYHPHIDGYLWTTTVSGPYALVVDFDPVDAAEGVGYRAFGGSVRCLKD